VELIIDNDQIKLGNTILPGVLESIEVEDDTKIDEVEIKGKKKKASQATEYNPTKVKINLNLLTDERSSAEEKLRIIARLYRPSKSHEKPLVYRIVCDQVQAQGVNEVVFTSLRSRGTNLDDMIFAALEFMEHQPINVSVQKISAKTGYTVHTVQKGETLSGIAKKYGTTVHAIAAANNISDAARVTVGQKLNIPTPSKKKSKHTSTTPAKVIDSRSWTSADIGKDTTVKDDAVPPKLKR